MSAVAGSFYLFSTAAFCLFCLAICVRLVRLSMRTGGRPERLLGLALGMTGGVGYGLLIVVSLATRARAGETSLLFTALQSWRARVEERNRSQGSTFSMVVPPAIFELASDLWEPPDADECQDRDVRFMRTDR